MTLQEIVNYANRKYPNQETDANKVIDLNKLQLELYMEFNKMSNVTSLDATDVTVADQAEYDLPTGVKIEYVVRIEVETGDGTGEYDEYKYAGFDDNIENQKVFKRGSTSAKYYLYDDELAINYADGTIRVYYYPRPTTLSAGTMTATPDLDELYHPLLCYGLIVELASQGHNPDVDMSNFYQARYDEYIGKVRSDIITKYATRGNERKQVRERW